MNQIEYNTRLDDAQIEKLLFILENALIQIRNTGHPNEYLWCKDMADSLHNLPEMIRSKRLTHNIRNDFECMVTKYGDRCKWLLKVYDEMFL